MTGMYVTLPWGHVSQ